MVQYTNTPKIAGIKRRTVLAASVASICVQSAFAQKSDKSNISIITTTGMIKDIVANILPDAFNVQNIIKEGVDPHLFQVTRSDFLEMLAADSILYNGYHLEGKLETTFKRLANKGRTVTAVAEYVVLDHQGEHEVDPHLWMDPALWKEVLDKIAAFLKTHYGEYANEIAQRHSEYSGKLVALNEYAKTVMATIPEAQRVLVTAHDAFYYFGKAFDLKVEGLQGISTESEAGLLHVETLINMLVERKINAVFTESTVSTRGIEALLQGSARQGHEVKIGGKLYSDAMGAPGTYEGTYIGMIEHNVNTIAAALGGSVPENGLLGWS